MNVNIKLRKQNEKKINYHSSLSCEAQGGKHQKTTLEESLWNICTYTPPPVSNDLPRLPLQVVAARWRVLFMKYLWTWQGWTFRKTQRCNSILARRNVRIFFYTNNANPGKLMYIFLVFVNLTLCFSIFHWIHQ